MNKLGLGGLLTLHNVITSTEVLEPADTLKRFVDALSFLNVNTKRMWKEIETKRAEFFRQHPWENHFFMPFSYWLRVFDHVRAFDSTFKKQICTENDLSSVGNRKYFGSMYQYMFTFVALVTWRVTKNVYEYEPSFADQLLKTNITSALSLSSQLFFKLPFHCVYIKTPALPISMFGLDELSVSTLFMGAATNSSLYGSKNLRGLFVMLDKHVVANKSVNDIELAYNPLLDQAAASLVICADTGSFTTFSDTLKYPKFEILRIPLGDWTLEQALAEPAGAAKKLMPLLGFVLYLCAANASIRRADTGASELAAAPKRFWSKHDVAKKPTVWNVGSRQGAVVKLVQDLVTTTREQQIEEALTTGSPRTTLRPHWRRAHWQSYWVGPRTTKTLELRWLEPILVNKTNPVFDQQLPVVNHQVSLL